MNIGSAMAGASNIAQAILPQEIITSVDLILYMDGKLFQILENFQGGGGGVSI